MSWLSERSRNGGIDEVPLPAGSGRLWLCGKHLIGPDPEAALERTGASVIVCLTEGHELSARYPDYVEWMVVSRGQRALFTPMPDLHATTNDIASIVDSIRLRLDAAGVLVSMGAPLDDALATVLASRPTAGPQSYEQELALRDYASSARNTAFPRADNK